MRTKKRSTVAPIFGSPAPANTPDNLQPLGTAPENGSEKPNRISFNVTPEGSPDWERMLPKTRAQLTDLLKDKSVQKELGISESQAKEISELGFGDDEANALLDLLSKIDSVAASKIYGVPMEVTVQAFEFTPDHRKKINPPLTRVLNKWGPAILKTWKDEIGLTMILFAVLNSQVTVMHILEAKRKRNAPAPAPAKVTPISEEKKEPTGD
jgi:hypothetical protein